MNIYTNSCICNWITWCLLLVQSCISQISSAVDMRVRINPVFFLHGVPFLVGDNAGETSFNHNLSSRVKDLPSRFLQKHPDSCATIQQCYNHHGDHE